MTSTTTTPPPRYRPHHHYPTTPSYYSPTSSTPSLLKGCCCCLFLLISLLFLLLLAVFLIILLALKPKKPHFDLQQVAVQNLAILPSPSTAADATTVSLSIRLIFTAANPNKVGIKYGHSRFTLMYRGVPLGSGTLDGFYQPAHSVTTVTSNVSVDKVSFMQSDGLDLVKDASLYDKVEFRVLGDCTAKVRVFQVNSPGVQVSVDCVIVISPRSQALTYKQCGFDGLNV
ncbi:uncharacterized protein LOC141611419 [Silene latifolia]|uniref:uncharacterized protein LOC141611419 n=1 Tax=Silene latifolia TaxID=37657 RepID=UPI003D779408